MNGMCKITSPNYTDLYAMQKCLHFFYFYGKFFPPVMFLVLIRKAHTQIQHTTSTKRVICFTSPKQNLPLPTL